MILIKGAFAFTMILLVSAGFLKLALGSVCHSENWRNEVQRVGQTLKDSPSFRPGFSCRMGGGVSWRFKGKL